MDDNSTPANNDEGKPAASGAVENKAGSNNPPAADVAKMAEEVGRLKAVEAEYKTYREKTEPVLETVWGDQEVFNTVNNAYLKKINKSSDTNDKDKSADKSDNPKITQIESKTDQNRNFAISLVVDQFNKDKGINKLDDDQKKDINTKVATALGEMLDPKGNKTLSQIMEDVDISKLPKFLDNAWHIATKEERMAEAKSIGRKEAEEELTGVIGSMPSGSISTEQISLTAKEKEVAKKMGVTEESYLKSKKEIVARDNSLI